ncbi:MAG TPA: aldo/keto reductase [Bacteroidetes bacterium]|nr:aldo/keto reductase [Bacteroidota bacterium]
MIRAHKTLHELVLSLASHQVKYSLLEREIEKNGILPAAKKLDITLIAYSPLELGILTGKFRRYRERIRSTGYRKWHRFFRRPGLKKSLPLIRLPEEIAENHGATAAAVALRIHLTGEELHRIDEPSKIVCRELL